jgi:hypothetical protein
VALAHGFQTPGTPARKATLSLGENLGGSEKYSFNWGSAAWHNCVLEPGNFKALGGAPLPKEFNYHTDFEFSSLGRIFALTPNTFCFSSDPLPNFLNYWYAFKLTGLAQKKINFINLNGNPMILSAFISEDEGATWQHPNAGVQRKRGDAYQGFLEFSHIFQNDTALIAASPLVTTDTVDAWLEKMQNQFEAKVKTIGTSMGGKPLRILEIGNPEAPLIYGQAGQHTMMERFGFFMLARLAELAAADPELLQKCRLAIMPVVNVDSYAVRPTEKIDRNMNRVWGLDIEHPTVKPLENYLKSECERTGGRIFLDCHAGSWPGHTILSPQPACKKFETLLQKHGLFYKIVYTSQKKDIEERGSMGRFSRFAAMLPGAQVCYTLELTVLSYLRDNTTEAATIEALQNYDAVCWLKAIKDFIG